MLKLTFCTMKRILYITKALLVTSLLHIMPIVRARDLRALEEEITPPCREYDPTTEYWCPAMRYCEWDHFTSRERRTFRRDLDYSNREWNYNRFYSYNDVSFVDLPENAKTALVNFGYDEDTNDCCITHYNDYDWSDFDVNDDGYDEVLDALKILGYDEGTWMEDEESEYEEFDWDELPADVQYALFHGLCYNRELWDYVELEDWAIDTLLPGETRQTMSPTTSVPTQSSMPSTSFPSDLPSTSPSKSFMPSNAPSQPPTISTMPTTSLAPTLSPAPTTPSPTKTPKNKNKD